MKNRQFLQNYFSNLFRLGSFILNSPEVDILDFFSDKSINVVDGIPQSRLEKVIVIGIEYAFINCLINRKGICSTCIIYLDNNPEIKKYFLHCTQTYPYEQLVEKWGIGDPDMLIGEYKESFYFILRKNRKSFSLK